MDPALPRTVASSPPTISRAERAHSRLSWAERLARHAQTDQADRITLTLFGIPERVAAFLGLATASSPPGGSDPSLCRTLPKPWADLDRFWWFRTKAVACQARAGDGLRVAIDARQPQRTQR